MEIDIWLSFTYEIPIYLPIDPFVVIIGLECVGAYRPLGDAEERPAKGRRKARAMKCKLRWAMEFVNNLVNGFRLL